MKSPPSLPVVLGCLLLCGAVAAGEVTVTTESATSVAIANKHLTLRFDLTKGTYQALDRSDGSVCLREAFWSIDDWSSRDAGVSHQWQTATIDDELGTGKTLTILSKTRGQPERLLQVAVYDDAPFVAMAGGLHNTTGKPVQVKAIRPLAGGTPFPDLDKEHNFRIIDGYGGAEPLEWGATAYTAVHRSNAVQSRNNLLVTFGENLTRRSLTIGGLTYTDYEKFAQIRQPRRTELASGPDGRKSLMGYLDLAGDRIDESATGPTLKLLEGEFQEHPHFGRLWCPELSTYALGKDRVVVQASGLKPDHPYTLGFSWWNMEMRSGNKPPRVQSIVIDQGPDTPRHVLLDSRELPLWSDPEKREAEQAEIPLPRGAYPTGTMRILVERVSGDPRVAISELWLRDGEAAPLLPSKPTAIDECRRPRRQFDLQLYADDPVGKRVGPGTHYLPGDRFYLDFITHNPFESLEGYGQSVRKAQQIALSMYDFPTVCLWYAHHKGYGGGAAVNTSVGAVAEAAAIKASGFLNYARAAVRLVPDTYEKNSQQGWWDEAHFQALGSSNLGDFPGGQYQEPYETTKKWGRAVTDLGCIPLMYCQTGFRSEDYAETFPGHMLFNKTHAWQNPEKTIPPDDEKQWAFPWGKAASLWSYDYTDPGFLAHLNDVYANYAGGGIKGLMFDYPASGWASGGGMEDASSTTAAAFRTIFRLPHEALGPESYVHERNMERGSDVTLGVIASQRTENDSDHINRNVVTRCGLRWYKNRVVVNYDTDSKNLLRAKSRDELRSLLTMSYTVTGRLLLANSFKQFPPETLHDLTRIYPFHRTPLTARPVDALTRKYPRVYDFRISPQWHQVVLYNTERETDTTVSVDLAGNTAEGALGLDPEQSYHVYDFWNDRYLGAIPGGAALTQKLRPNEARMLSVREMRPHPQVVSTDRHVMQGLLELDQLRWDADERTLSGTVRLPAGDPVTIMIVTNGFQAATCAADDPVRATLEVADPGSPVVKLRLATDGNRVIQWRVRFHPAAASGR
ncbi:MAG: hypothetical protein K9N23_19210 [Akkermansiaceae bacterium]|nr:hypothetical protein [Akkermansiaceae bacterium]